MRWLALILAMLLGPAAALPAAEAPKQAVLLKPARVFEAQQVG